MPPARAVRGALHRSIGPGLLGCHRVFIRPGKVGFVNLVVTGTEPQQRVSRGRAEAVLSVGDRLVAEFEGRVTRPVVTGVTARCAQQLQGQGLPEAALPELLERLARADLVDLLAEAC